MKQRIYLAFRNVAVQYFQYNCHYGHDLREKKQAYIIILYAVTNKKNPSHTVFINVTKSQKDSNNEFITVTFHE